jgi:antitoxin (DNA-binding transcriptional repressor) of toxin-antitoxin stability system
MDMGEPADRIHGQTAMTISIEQAQKELPHLIEAVTRGNEVVITRDDEPVAQLVRAPSSQPAPVFGSCRGMVTVVSDDEEHLKDFEEYMP